MPILSGQSSLSINDSFNYGIEFNFIYQTNPGEATEKEILLEIGENDLSSSKENVVLTMLHTRWNSLCYKINTTRRVDHSNTAIVLNTSGSKKIEKAKFFFTADDNSYGVTYNKFMDGKAFSTELVGGEWKEIYLSVEKNINWACSKESFFKRVALNLSIAKSVCEQLCQ